MFDGPEHFIRTRAALWLLAFAILPAFLGLTLLVGALGLALEALFGGWLT
jgi:hypothetical protein